MKDVLLKGITLARELLDKAENSLGVESASLPPDVQGEEPRPEQNAEPKASTFEDRVPMNDALRAWARVSGHTVKELRARLRARMEVERIDFMTKAQVQDACAWINARIEAARTLGKTPAQRPGKKTTGT